MKMNIQAHRSNRNPNFLRLIEHLRQSLREREFSKEQQQQRRKIYSINHFIEYLRRCMQENPLLARVLFRFHHTIKNFSSQTNHFSSTIIVESETSKTSLEENTSKSDLSKISVMTAQSTRNFMQSSTISRQMNSLLTKATFNAITKTSHQRTTTDIEVLEHLLTRCESLRHLPNHVRRYTARSVFLLTYPSNTIIACQNDPPFLVYMLVSGQCHLLLKTNETTLFGPQLSIGDVYGDEPLDWIGIHRLNGLITNENQHCSLIGFFIRDIRAYENYLSDMMKQSLLEQFRSQSMFLAMQWRTDIFDYFLKWTKYKQYSVDQIIYGNERDEHENLYFILRGQVSFVCLFEFPLMAIKYPGFYRKNIQRKNRVSHVFLQDCQTSINPEKTLPLNSKTTWRFLEIFALSNGHYFGFESTNHHSWYLTRSTVDIISIPKIRFKQLGLFAPMIFEKLRQDFLDILPDEHFIRQSYIQHLQMNQSEVFPNQTRAFLNTKYNPHSHQLDQINWIPSATILSTGEK